MKTLDVLKVLGNAVVAVVLLNLGYSMGYHQKNSEHYKAACILSDAIRIEYDTIEDEEKNCTYSAYSALEEGCCELGIDTDSLLRSYVWCY